MAPTLQHCSVDPFDEYYFEFAYIYPVVLLLQLILLCNAIWGELAPQHRSKRKHSRLSKRVWLFAHALYFILQFIGMYYTINEFLRFAIDTKTHVISRDPYACYVASYTPKLIPNLYYGLYLYQILLRLKHSFHDSYLELRKSVFICLAALIIVGNVLFPILFVILNDSQPCMEMWHQLETGKIANICGLPLSPQTTFPLIVCGIVYVVACNLLLCALFSVKLMKLMSGQKENEDAHFRIKSLVIKNCVLAITGALSSMLSYSLWMTQLPIRAVFLQLDVFINCLVIGLMFNYNEKYYRRLCKCCIVMSFINCTRHKDKKTTEELRQSIRLSLYHYFNDEIELDSIFAMTNMHQRVRVSSVGDRDIGRDRIASITLDVVTRTEDHVHHNHVEPDDSDNEDRTECIERVTTEDIENEILHSADPAKKRNVIRVE